MRICLWGLLLQVSITVAAQTYKAGHGFGLLIPDSLHAMANLGHWKLNGPVKQVVVKTFQNTNEQTNDRVTLATNELGESINDTFRFSEKGALQYLYHADGNGNIKTPTFTYGKNFPKLPLTIMEGDEIYKYQYNKEGKLLQKELWYTFSEVFFFFFYFEYPDALTTLVKMEYYYPQIPAKHTSAFYNNDGLVTKAIKHHETFVTIAKLTNEYLPADSFNTVTDYYYNADKKPVLEKHYQLSLLSGTKQDYVTNFTQYIDSTITAYTYNSLNQLSQKQQTIYRGFPVSRLLEEGLDTSKVTQITTTYEYDTNGQVTKETIFEAKKNAQPKLLALKEYSYQYDQHNNPTRIQFIWQQPNLGGTLLILQSEVQLVEYGYYK